MANSREWERWGHGVNRYRDIDLGYAQAPELPRESYRGRGPKGYVRSDGRIAEELNWVLTEAIDVDATHIEPSVSNGEVHLRGAVVTRDERARAEELARHVFGVRHVINELEVRRPDLKRRF